ncbi:MAG TPA: type IV secretion protein Rhs, partial [Flavobacterium sp.]
IMHNVFVGGDSELKVKGKLTETIEGDIQTHTKEGMIMNSQKDVAYNTEGEITKHSNSSVQVNSTEKSKFF